MMTSSLNFNPYVTVSSTGQYTKHYFEGSKRFASRLMDGAVRFEDPSVLYTNRMAEDKDKKADTEADFRKYLQQTDLGSNVSVELKEVYQSPDLYYLHGDHLGTATFVTNSQAQATQFFLNLPFGETMVEQTDGSYNNPYKFNAKELDEDTGLYYYGARYYNPRLSIWYGVDPLAEKMPSWSPYNYTYDNPVKYTDPDGQAPSDIVFMGLNGREIHRIKSNTVFKTYMIDINARSVAVRGLTANGGKGWIEAAMPNIIQEKGGGNTTGSIYQKYDNLIASETGYFNQYKNAGITPKHTNGLSIDNPSTVPDLDPTLVKATIMQESMMGSYDANPSDSNNSKSDIMQANVYYSNKSNDWGDHKTQFGLTEGGGATPEQSVNAGIGLMYQKGLTTTNGKTRWAGGKTWDNTSKNYNGGGASNYGNVLKMRDAAKKPQPKNY